MSIQPICDFCHKELEDFGGLIFSPPEKGHGAHESEEQNVQKLHVCRTCYEGMHTMFMKVPRSQAEMHSQNTLTPQEKESTPESAGSLLKIGIYKHSKKGTLYRVIAVAKHSETLEDLVVYEAIEQNDTAKYWVRPLSMFTEHVFVNGSFVPRFVFVSDTL